MRLGPYEFRPRLLPALVTLALLPALLALGFWQLDRAEQKRALLAQWEAGKRAAPSALSELGATGSKDADTRFRRVRAKGQYDQAHQFLLDNQIREGRAGFQVLTPLRLAGREKAVLINRGWVPMGASRRDLPDLPAPEGEQQLRGILTDPPSVGIRLGEADTGGNDWPKVVQYVAPERIQKQLGYPVMERVIQLGRNQPHGFERDWEAPVHFGPQRHVGYAVQWFGLAAALLAIFLVVNTKRSKPAHAESIHERFHADS
ncbi:SURF1 family protein [Thiohalorhabdus sp. Cl-TMA]|uniref:SURF1-like protein n=1 Tax=Thiohalorhabdus methylotrophus TaxID=3242694 RepID=A0ABV4TQB9_9GAMM